VIWEDGEGGKEESVKAQVSTTWVPWVFITFMVEPAGRAVAIPWRAGMVVNVMFLFLKVIYSDRELKRKVVK
jgi:hypothetical protein